MSGAMTTYKCGDHSHFEASCTICETVKEFRSLQDENVRLRDALERITKASRPHEEPVSREIARAALENGKEWA